MNVWRLAIILGAAVLVLAAPLRSQGAARLESVDGEALEGRLVRINADSVVLEVAGTERSVPLRRAVALRLGKGSIAPPGARSGLLRFDLAGGDRVFGTVVESSYDEVRVSTRTLGVLTLPLDVVRRMTVLDNVPEGGFRPLEIPSRGDRDVLYVQGPKAVDFVLGVLARFRQDGVLFEWGDAGESVFGFETDRVLAVDLAAQEAADAIEGVHAVVWFRDGGRLTGRVAGAGNRLELETGVGRRIPLQLDQVHEIAFRGGDFLFLSDLEPLEIAETPYIEGGLLYGLHRDRSLRGGVPTIGEALFPKALCVHTRCALRYAVPEGFRYLTTAVGLDGAVAARDVRGSVAFSVLLDGEAIAEPVLRRAGEEPVWLRRLDVGAGGELTLLADFADRAHFNGWAVWGGAMFVRDGAD